MIVSDENYQAVCHCFRVRAIERQPEFLTHTNVRCFPRPESGFGVGQPPNRQKISFPLPSQLLSCSFLNYLTFLHVMYKGLHVVARRAPKSAFLTPLSSRNNVSAGKLSYTTSRASAQFNKQNVQDDDNRGTTSQSPFLPRTTNWPRLSQKQQRLPQNRYNHSLAVEKQQPEASGEINSRIMELSRADDQEAVVAEFVAGRKAGETMLPATYNAVLEAYGSLQKVNRPVSPMLTVYDDMVENGVLPTSHSYAILIRMLCARENEVNRKMNQMKRRVRKSGDPVYELEELENEQNLDRAIALFQRAVKERATGDFDVHLYNDLLLSLSNKGKTQDALYILEHLENSRNVRPNSATFSRLIQLFGRAGDIAAVQECFGEYKSLASRWPKHNPAIIYQSLVKAYVAAGELSGALDVVNNLMVKDGITVDIRPYNSILRGAVEQGKLELAENLLRQLKEDANMPKPDASTYGILLSHYSHTDNVDKAKEMYQEMLKQDISSQYSHFSDYIALCRRKQLPEEGLDVIKTMISRGYAADINLTRDVLMTYADMRQMDKAAETLQYFATVMADNAFVHERSSVSVLAMELVKYCERLPEALEMMRSIKNYGVKPDEPAAKRVINLYQSTRKDPASWEEFRQKLNKDDYEILCDSLFRYKDDRDVVRSTAFELLDDMVAAGIKPNVSFYVRFSSRLKKYGDNETHEKWEQKFSPYLQDVKEESKHYDVEASIQSMKAFDKAVAGDFDGCIQILQKDIIDKGLAPSPDAVRDVILQAIRRQKPEEAQRIFDLSMSAMDRLSKSWRYRAKYLLYNCMLIVHARYNGLEAAKQMYRQMRELEMVPDGDAYGALLTCSAQSAVDESADALQIYEEAKSFHVRPTVYFYNVILSKLAKCRKIDLVMKLFDEMQRLGVHPNGITYAAVITAHIKISSETGAEHYFQELYNNPKFAPRIGVFNSMIQFYVQQKQNRDRALYYYQLLTECNLQPTSHTYKLLMEAYANIPPYDMLAAHNLLSEMNSKGIQPGATHYATLIQSYGQLHRDVQSAEAIFNEMRKAKVQPDGIVYQALLDAYIGNNKMESAETLYKNMLAEGSPSSAYIENLFIKGYGELGALDKAEEAWNRTSNAKNSNVSVVREPSTYEAMVKAYLANNERDKAFHVVEEMRSSRNFPPKVQQSIVALLSS